MRASLLCAAVLAACGPTAHYSELEMGGAGGTSSTSTGSDTPGSSSSDGSTESTGEPAVRGTGSGDDSSTGGESSGSTGDDVCGQHFETQRACEDACPVACETIPGDYPHCAC